jgi:hypothetical protein
LKSSSNGFIEKGLSMYFDRYGICEAYLLLEAHYNVGGWLHERPSNQRRREATACQLARMGFHSRYLKDENSLTENGKAIYKHLEKELIK